MYLNNQESLKWGVSSAGRAPALQAGGHRFDPGTLHHKRLTEVPSKEEASLSFLKKRFKECTLKTEHCYYDAIMRRQHKGKFIYKNLGNTTISAKISIQYEPA